MKLKGINLTIIDIHRKGIFDMNAMVFCCDNCGRAIVNSATVKDDNGKVYVIGLDCKKTLIDKKIIDAINSDNSKMDCFKKQDIKNYKREQSDIVNVMKYLDNPVRYECKCMTYGGYQDFIVYDNTQENQFGNMGKIVFSESIPYLFRIGLENVLKAALSKGIIKQN